MRLMACLCLCIVLLVGCSHASTTCASAVAGVKSENLPFTTRRPSANDPALQHLQPPPGHGTHPYGVVSSFGNGNLVIAAALAGCVILSSVTVTSDRRVILQFKTLGAPCAGTPGPWLVTARTKPATPRPTTVLLLQGCRHL